MFYYVSCAKRKCSSGEVAIRAVAGWKPEVTTCKSSLTEILRCRRQRWNQGISVVVLHPINLLYIYTVCLGHREDSSICSIYAPLFPDDSLRLTNRDYLFRRKTGGYKTVYSEDMQTILHVKMVMEIRPKYMWTSTFPIPYSWHSNVAFFLAPWAETPHNFLYL